MLVISSRAGTVRKQAKQQKWPVTCIRVTPATVRGSLIVGKVATGQQVNRPLGDLGQRCGDGSPSEHEAAEFCPRSVPTQPGPEQSCLTSLYDSVGSDGLEIFSVKILDSSNKICAF